MFVHTITKIGAEHEIIWEQEIRTTINSVTRAFFLTNESPILHVCQFAKHVTTYVT